MRDADAAKGVLDGAKITYPAAFAGVDVSGTIYRRAIEHGRSDARLALAELLVDADRLAEAETQLKLAIESGDSEAIEHLAVLYEETGRHAEARSLRDSR
ncbi:hypothetical protein BH20ACT17_BH20ACT17_15120 [soil metagenome]